MTWVFSCLLISSMSQGQSIVRSTFCGAGATLSSGSATLTSTFGQCPGCGTLSTNTGHLTQGFQQTDNDKPCFTAGIGVIESTVNCRTSYTFNYTGNASLGDVSFEWDFGETATPRTSTEANPQGITFISAGTSNIRLVVNGLDCNRLVTLDAVVLALGEDCDFYIEDAVSPNNDGQNETWVIRGIDQFPENEVSVFNRWGQEVWRQKGYNNDWTGTNEDGDLLPVGAYYYVLKLNDANNRVLSGSVTIIR